MRLHRFVGGLVCAMLWASASAAPITFAFEVAWSAGPLAGTSNIGLVTVDGSDCPGGICTGVFTPDNAANTLLNFGIQVDGRSFAAGDDGLFPAFPEVTFSGFGDITDINYDALVNGMNLVLFGGVATYFPPAFPGGPDRSFGFVTVIGQVGEPATAALLAGALLLAPWLRRRAARRTESLA